MIDLPTGTITFLFTDIEGGIQFWERRPVCVAGDTLHSLIAFWRARSLP